MTSADNYSLEPYNGPWTNMEVKHLFKRCTFGISFNDNNAMISKGFESCINLIFEIDSNIIPYPINNYSSEDSNVPLGKEWFNAPYNTKFDTDRKLSVIYEWYGRIFDAKYSIKEKMIVFWANHYGVNHSMNTDAKMNFRYLEVLNKYVLGNFRKMIFEITKDPLMLTFLNGFLNEARLPDENYARELMELFTLGKGPNSKYTEDDVKAAAKVLTGFIYNPTNGTSEFNSDRHNSDDKKFSSFFDNKIIKGLRKDENTNRELNDLLNMIFEQKECSKFICRKLYTFFVNNKIDQNIEEKIIIPLSEILINNNFEISIVLKKMIQSEHFFSMANYGNYIKSPVDFYFNLHKEIPIALPNKYYETQAYQNLMGNTWATLYYLQQHLSEPPNVAGWPAYYQRPIFDKSWLNGETIKIRQIVINEMCENNVKLEFVAIKLDFVKFVENIVESNNPNILINKSLEFLTPFKPKQKLINNLKLILLGNQQEDFYWTNDWNEFQSNKQNLTLANSIKFRLKEFYKTILSLDEYQLH